MDITYDMAPSNEDKEDRYSRLIELGIALSSQRDHNRLMEMILLGAKEITNADGGTLYLLDHKTKTLHFEILRNDTLGSAMGGTTGVSIPFPPLSLYKSDGSPNNSNISTSTALSAQTINITDAYDVDKYDFSGTKAFDAKTGYRSKSFLNVPLKNHENEVVGVLQLINARTKNGDVTIFEATQVKFVEALASQAAVALDNRRLIEAQKNLFTSFIQVIANAIDAKSAYTGGHCRRVPALANMLTHAAVEATEGVFADFTMNPDQWYELEIASGLHDCGKVTTPVQIVDKATKLETIYNRIHEIRMRFEVVKRDAEIDYWKGLATGGNEESLRSERDQKISQLDDDFAFIAGCNVGGEMMAPDKIDRLKKIGNITWMRTLDDSIGLSWEESRRKPKEKVKLPVQECLISDKPEHLIHHERNPAEKENPWGFKVKIPDYRLNLGEIYNLSILRGTLTDEERYHINDHIVQTIIMLESLPFPRTLEKVPTWAGGHHEKLNGTGYPKCLVKEDMDIPTRIMAVADIFEALTARDRPYNTPKKLSECIKILSFMKKDNHIDPDIFHLFLSSGVYKKYAEAFLLPDQIDEVDVSQYLPK